MCSLYRLFGGSRLVFQSRGLRSDPASRVDSNACTRSGRVTNELTDRTRGYRLDDVYVGGRVPNRLLRSRKASAANRASSAHGNYGDQFQGRIASDERGVNEP